MKINWKNIIHEAIVYLGLFIGFLPQLQTALHLPGWIGLVAAGISTVLKNVEASEDAQSNPTPTSGQSTSKVNLPWGVGALALVISVLALTGCGTLDPSGVYHGNKYLYDADAAMTQAYVTIDEFEKFDLNNRAALSAGEHQVADKIRVQAPQLARSYFTLRAVYVANPTATSKASVQAILTDVQGLVSAALVYFTPNVITK